MRELGDDVKDSTIKLFLDPSRKLEELYFKVNYRWRAADTFLILNNVIGSRIGNYFYPYFPPDTMKKGEMFVRFLRQGNNILADVFNKLGDTILYSTNAIAFFEPKQYELKNNSSIDSIIKRDLNYLPFFSSNALKDNDSIVFFKERFFFIYNYSDKEKFDDYKLIKNGELYHIINGETIFKKSKLRNLIFLEGDCETFLKGKPTFLKEIK
jgi:hypothetical protein